MAYARNQLTALPASCQVRALGSIRHANIVQLLGYAHGDESKGELALVFELLGGGSLDMRLGQQPPLTVLKR